MTMTSIMNSFFGIKQGAHVKQTSPVNFNKMLFKRPTCGIFVRSLAETADGKEILKPTDAQKSILVKSGMFKTIEDIPESISKSQLKRAKEVQRIRNNMWMVAATVAACGIMVFYGRRLQYSEDNILETTKEKHHGQQ